MSNPNKTVYAARNRKWHLAEEFIFPPSQKSLAYAKRDDLREQYPRVRVTRFNLGPRDNPSRQYAVRAYNLA